MFFPDALHVIDSHTEGEPTRVVTAGWPELRADDMAGRREELLREWDHLRSAVVCEPRGHDAVVGALLTPPTSADSVTGVVFFNNVGALYMCGHGLIGVVRTLAHLGRIAAGEVRIDTAVGVVSAWLNEDGSVTIRNVVASCHELDVELDVPGLGRIRGDIAYGGNWFFITEVTEPALELANLTALTRATTAISHELVRRGITGAGGAVIDHVELTAPTPDPVSDSVNFVLCPGGAFDRSPCGTGTSAKLAVLHARGAIAPGAVWRQRSVTGGRFDAWLEEHAGELRPHVRGRAWITAHSRLQFDESDPFRAGFAAVSG
jgi:4-hydroxyproline epimerase